MEEVSVGVIYDTLLDSNEGDLSQHATYIADNIVFQNKWNQDIK